VKTNKTVLEQTRTYNSLSTYVKNQETGIKQVKKCNKRQQDMQELKKDKQDEKMQRI